MPSGPGFNIRLIGRENHIGERFMIGPVPILRLLAVTAYPR
jgi:hypothetical protein